MDASLHFFFHAEVKSIVAVNDGPVVVLCESGKLLQWVWEGLESFDEVPRSLHYEGLKFLKIAVGESHALALAETGEVGRASMQRTTQGRRSFFNEHTALIYNTTS